MSDEVKSQNPVLFALVFPSFLRLFIHSSHLLSHDFRMVISRIIFPVPLPSFNTLEIDP